MRIIIAKDAGYCFGVRDAVNFLLQKEEKPLSVKVVVSEVITNLIR